MLTNKKEPAVLTGAVVEEILEVVHEAYVEAGKHNQESTKAVEKTVKESYQADKELHQADKELNKL